MPGEQVVRLRSLTVPDADAGLEDLTRADATRLFVERASALGSQTFDASDAQAIVEICRRLDGIPLAIELAAAGRRMSPSEIAGLLDERFRLLTGGRRASVERHQTLRAAIEWSYSLLGDTERKVFDRLGVFPATFDAAAAEAVAADEIEDWDVIDALSSLVAKSMLVADRTSTGSTRYQMLETMRQCAAKGSTLRTQRIPTAAVTPSITPTLSAEAGGRTKRRRTGEVVSACGSRSTTSGEPSLGRLTPPMDGDLALRITADLCRDTFEEWVRSLLLGRSGRRARRARQPRSAERGARGRIHERVVPGRLCAGSQLDPGRAA